MEWVFENLEKEEESIHLVDYNEDSKEGLNVLEYEPSYCQNREDFSKHRVCDIESPGGFLSAKQSLVCFYKVGFSIPSRILSDPRPGLTTPRLEPSRWTLFKKAQIYL
jgi:hypothetical protein